MKVGNNSFDTINILIKVTMQIIYRIDTLFVLSIFLVSNIKGMEGTSEGSALTIVTCTEVKKYLKDYYDKPNLTVTRFSDGYLDNKTNKWCSEPWWQVACTLKKSSTKEKIEKNFYYIEKPDRGIVDALLRQEITLDEGSFFPIAAYMEDYHKNDKITLLDRYEKRSYNEVSNPFSYKKMIGIGSVSILFCLLAWIAKKWESTPVISIAGIGAASSLSYVLYEGFRQRPVVEKEELVPIHRDLIKEELGKNYPNSPLLEYMRKLPHD